MPNLAHLPGPRVRAAVSLQRRAAVPRAKRALCGLRVFFRESEEEKVKDREIRKSHVKKEFKQNNSLLKERKKTDKKKERNPAIYSRIIVE